MVRRRVKKTYLETKEFYDRYESITKKEFNAAIMKDVPVYILVSRAVYVEYETFRKNRDNDKIEYAQVESVNVFHLLDEVLSSRRNNPLHQFDHHGEIEEWLREQWAGLFRELLSRRSEHRQLITLAERMDELSAINSSLQRYMEEIVRANKTPEDAREIINEEKEKQDEAKRKRDFERTMWGETFRILQIPYKAAEKVFQDAQTMEDLIYALAPILGHDADALIESWSESKAEFYGKCE